MFITFEGPEGAGKSSVVKSLTLWLQEKGVDVVATREPGDGDLGKKVREILLHGESIAPKTELMLYLADRAEHVAKTIRPGLEDGKTVLCDRYTDSTIAYQGYGRGFDIAEIKRLNEFVTDRLTPDKTLLLDLEPSVGLARIRNRDRLDREPLEFHEKVRLGFLTEANNDPARWILIDASRPLNEVVERCRETISVLLNL